jgi:2-oxoisovalerate dehydrogenase E1 component
MLDDKMLILLRQGRSYFHIGASGHEAAQVGAALAFRPEQDWAFPYYRDQAFVLQWGVSPEDILYNFLAKASDPSSGGRQLPQHYGHAEKHIVSQSSPTGTQYLQAVGTAMGCQKNNSDAVVFVSSGEGATSQGDFYEAINWATRDRLPVLFFIEDNKYAISVHRDQQAAGRSVYDMVLGYENLHRHETDGTDLMQTYKTVQHCVDVARKGEGPSLIVAHTIRLLSHSSSDDQKKYRDAKELDEEKTRDPIRRFENLLKETYDVDSAKLNAIGDEIKKRLDKATDTALNAPMPDPQMVTQHLFSPHLPKASGTVSLNTQEKPITMVDAINHGLKEAMEADKTILLYGQDVADRKGGVFGVTRGLSSRFGSHRVFNSPLAESSIVGTAIGLAISGYRPVVEIQFGDYIWTAMMQIRNELTTMRWRSVGTFFCPIVVRVPIGGYIHGGLCHSQNIESFFAHMPGLYIAYPSNAADAKGLLKWALQVNDPVLFLEHKGLYRQQYAMRPEPSAETVIPFGQAQIVRNGHDATVVTWGYLVNKSLRVAKTLEEQGYQVEVIDMRTLAPLDIQTILDSVKKTGRLLVAHEDTLTGGMGGEIVALVSQQGFQYLDAPIRRVASLDTPVPYNWDLEKQVLVQEETIKSALVELLEF